MLDELDWKLLLFEEYNYFKVYSYTHCRTHAYSESLGTLSKGCSS